MALLQNTFLTGYPHLSAIPILTTYVTQTTSSLSVHGPISSLILSFHLPLELGIICRRTLEMQAQSPLSNIALIGIGKHPESTLMLDQELVQSYMPDYSWNVAFSIHTCIVKILFHPRHVNVVPLRNKKVSNDQELIQSDPTSCPENQKGNN